MKTKYLFGMLLSGALLTACTADDALDAAKVANKSAMQAPVFTVSLDQSGLENRGTLETTNTSKPYDAPWKLKLDGTDKLSLFHGIGEYADGDWKFAASDPLKGWQNAIYEPKDGSDSEGRLEFVTHAMVQRGYAIMVYPADLGFSQMNSTTTQGTTGAAAPVVKITADQTRETRDQTPYMSEFIKLQDPDTEDVEDYETAGFGKEYQLILKRAAGTLFVNLGYTPLTVTGVDAAQEVRAVEIAYETETFPTQLSIEVTEDPAKPTSQDTYKSWAAVSGLDIVNTGAKSKYLKTTDIEDNKDATFTILPWEVDAESKPTNGTFKVYTNYGIVTINTKDGKSFGSKGDKNLDDIFVDIAELLYHKAENGTFKGEWTGNTAAVDATIDMTKATVDGLHIDNEADLITALQVYNAREKATVKKNVTITLDGDEEDGVFTMTAATLQLLSDAMVEGAKDANKGLKVAACAIESEELNTIVVTGSNGAEVPSLIFVDEAEGVSKTVDVQLEGSWKYTGVEDNPSTTTVDERKVMKNVETIVNNGTLTMSGYITAAKEALGDKSEVKFVNAGTINVSGETYTKLNIDNYGTINIPATAKLLVDDSSVLTNMEAQAQGKTAATAWDKGAEIVNEGWLGVVEKSDDEEQAINNYGIIYSKGKARTFVTANAREDVEDLGTAFETDETAIGTIIIDSPLMKKDYLVVVGDEETYQGFILLEINKTNPTFAEIGDVANYVLLSGSCEGVTFTAYNSTKKAYENLPDNVKYIEVNSSKEVTFYSDGITPFELTGLFVRSTSAGAAVPEAVTIKVTEELYVAKQVALGGTIDLSELESTIEDVWSGYHNGDGGSYIKNVVSTGKGKITE